MTPRALGLALVLAILCTIVWRGELYTVQRPGERPRDLVAIDVSRRDPLVADVVLPAVPMGGRRVRSGDGVTLIYYWAPWQQSAYAQAAALDSLRRGTDFDAVRIQIVCFDPFPSVARYVARRRLAVPVLLDTRGTLRALLPCPSLPYTYVLDAAGRIAVRQPGRVDWLSPKTRATLQRILHEAPAPAPATRGSA
jgi:hypothetical protein